MSFVSHSDLWGVGDHVYPVVYEVPRLRMVPKQVMPIRLASAYIDVSLVLLG